MPTPTNERVSFFWSDRIVLVSAAGILFLTLFPFRFVSHARSEGMFPFFHGRMTEGKGPGALDVFLNIMLFVPFGFGIAGKLREKGKSLATTLVVAWAAGALLSYTVEVLQIYIPSRDSGWGDVITNSSGSVVGFLAYETYGKWVLHALRGAESALRIFLAAPDGGPCSAGLFRDLVRGVLPASDHHAAARLGSQSDSRRSAMTHGRARGWRGRDG